MAKRTVEIGELMRELVILGEKPVEISFPKYF